MARRIPKAALDWIRGSDTGVSSQTIWETLAGRELFDLSRFGHDAPCDPSDFGRCYRLLKAVPAWRKRLGEVASKWPVWAPLVAVWDELERLWEEESPTGTCPKLWRRMQELRGFTPVDGNRLVIEVRNA